ncbi:MAG: winged helix-turn-helix domain-containing protein [Thaumarchaeota archaeon]|nr:winged helix-turn-helix domain-containing protein [Nitrososphaerota archaeon]
MITATRKASASPKDMVRVEELFSSYGRVKIMSIMMDSDELNISEITRRSGISHSSVEAHLELMVALGLLTEKRFNRIRIFRVNHSNRYTNAVSRFLSEWRAISSDSSGQAVARAFS